MPRTAREIRRASLSSAAIRLGRISPQPRQRCSNTHSSLRTQMAIGSMRLPQSAARSPGVLSRCRLCKHRGQWLRCRPPPGGGPIRCAHCRHRKSSDSRKRKLRRAWRRWLRLGRSPDRSSEPDGARCIETSSSKRRLRFLFLADRPRTCSAPESSCFRVIFSKEGGESFWIFRPEQDDAQKQSSGWLRAAGPPPDIFWLNPQPSSASGLTEQWETG